MSRHHTLLAQYQKKTQETEPTQVVYKNETVEIPPAQLIWKPVIKAQSQAEITRTNSGSSTSQFRVGYNSAFSAEDFYNQENIDSRDKNNSYTGNNYAKPKVFNINGEDILCPGFRSSSSVRARHTRGLRSDLGYKMKGDYYSERFQPNDEAPIHQPNVWVTFYQSPSGDSYTEPQKVYYLPYEDFGYSSSWDDALAVLYSWNSVSTDIEKSYDLGIRTFQWKIKSYVNPKTFWFGLASDEKAEYKELLPTFDLSEPESQQFVENKHNQTHYVSQIFGETQRDSLKVTYFDHSGLYKGGNNVK